jgi:hypothetical protein
MILPLHHFAMNTVEAFAWGLASGMSLAAFASIIYFTVIRRCGRQDAAKSSEPRVTVFTINPPIR